jgi:hypothetical protein
MDPKPATDYEILCLETTAQAGDEVDFVQSVAAINWYKRSAKDFERAIRLALQAGALLMARQLSELGAQRYPDHAKLQKFARILAPPRVIDAHLPPDPNAGADIEWLKTHADEYRGQWVAIQGGELLASAPTMQELAAIIGNPKGTGILVTKVY